MFNEKIKIAVLGSNGMLGQALMASIKLAGCKAYGLARDKSDYCVDVLDESSMRSALDEIGPDVVINCVAIVDLGKCESEPSLAYMTNSHPSAFLSSYCSDRGKSYVYISTDHYYSGRERVFNSEIEPVNLCNEYATTKYLGEVLALENGEALVVRTNIVGFRGDPERPTFLEWLFYALENGDKIKAFDDFMTSSIDVETFSNALLEIISKGTTGLINLASNEVSSKSEFIKSIVKEYGYTMANVEITSMPTSDKIQRNTSLGLCVKRAESILNESLPGLNETIKRLKKQKYKQYEL